MRARTAAIPLPVSRQDCVRLDAADPLRHVRERFVLPEGIVYLDGNSLGPMPRGAADRLERAAQREWADGLIRSWNAAGWFHLPTRAGDKIARLIGAPAGSVIVADTISVNLFKLLGAATALRPNRKVILTDNGNFPSDIYVAEGLLRHLGQEHALKIVDPEAVEEALDDTVAVLMLTDVDYRSGRIHDMRALTRKAHRVGALTVWDLAHSAGAIEVDLTAAGADLAHGCTYKYLNGGPGAPAFLYVRPDLQAEVMSPIQGWWGHAAPFAFDLDYRPAAGIARMQCGTQPVLSLSALDAALDAWEDVDMRMVREKTVRLGELLVSRAAACARYGLKLYGPLPEQRGAQLSFRCPEAYAVMQALIADGVIGDFRAPDLIRFGLTPLYTRYVDIWDAADRLERVLAERRWDDPRFLARKAVT